MRHLRANSSVLVRPPKIAPPPRDFRQAKLALAETLLTTEDVAELAEHAMAWLANHAGARKANCLVVDPNRRLLIGLAARGVPPAPVEGFSLDLEDRPHPHLTALSRTPPS